MSTPSVPQITTVCGPIQASRLGFCQCHEHLWISNAWVAEVDPAQRIDDEAASLAELRDYLQAGGAAVCDAQACGCGRDADKLQALSRASGVNIIASTGFHRMCYYPQNHWVKEMGGAQLQATWTHELERGMYLDCDTAMPTRHSGSRAGFIKTALEPQGLAGRNALLFQAAAATASATGAALMVHVEKGADAPALAEWLVRQGVRGEKLIFCHMDRAQPDLALHRAVADTGACLEYDTVENPKHHSSAREVEIIAEMAAAGYADRLLLSMDLTRRRAAAYGGSPGLAFIPRSFVPMLRAIGLGQQVLQAIFHTNPARVFARSA